MAEADLVLIDGSSYLYRAYHALPKLSNSAGEPTGALHGVLTMINKLVREQPAGHIAVVFDAPGKTFRDDMYAEYKANRPPMPDDLREQVEPLIDAVRAMGLPLLRVEGVEADDVIGTLCRKSAEQGLNVLVSTVDKDMAQLVGDKVTLVNTMTGHVLDRDGVKKKFEVFPEQIIDYLALVGDSSDNIPGVPRVGAKTAAKWLNQYPSADDIIDNAGDIGGKVGESLRENIEQLRLSRQLATIRQDLDLPTDFEDLTPGDVDEDALREIYGRFELRQLLRQLDGDKGDSPVEQVEAGGDYETILDWTAFDRWFKAINDAELVAFDTETTSLDYMEAQLVGISLSVETGKAAYIPVAHDYPGAPEQLPREVRRPHPGALRHRARGHGVRLDARILRIEQCRNAPRHGFDRAPLPGPRNDPLRRRRRQGREAAHLQPGRPRDSGALRGRRRGYHATAARETVVRARQDRVVEESLLGDRAAAGSCAAGDGGSRSSHRQADARRPESRTDRTHGRTREAGA
jgi:DNA polymerase-1